MATFMHTYRAWQRSGTTTKAVLDQALIRDQGYQMARKLDAFDEVNHLIVPMGLHWIISIRACEDWSALPTLARLELMKHWALMKSGH